MDALTLLNEHIDVVKLMSHYDFNKVNEEGNMVRSCCKIHDGNNPSAFVMNVDTGLWYCHTGDCGGGDAYTLVQRLENCDFHTAVKKIATLFGVDIENLVITERKETYMRELQNFIKLMQSRKKTKLPPYYIPEDIKEVAKFRTFNESTLEKFGLGYVEEVSLFKRTGEPYTLRNRLVFPIIMDAIQIGISFRKIRAEDYPKWSHQPVHLETKNILYNYDATLGQRTVVVVEGIPDVWAYDEIGVVAVCTFGAHMADEQYRLLMRTGADLVFSYDGDEAGRLATKKAMDMFRYKANMECVVFDEGEDPDNIPREELKKRYENRRKL
jgi:DNA primase